MEKKLQKFTIDDENEYNEIEIISKLYLKNYERTL